MTPTSWKTTPMSRSMARILILLKTLKSKTRRVGGFVSYSTPRRTPARRYSFCLNPLKRPGLIPIKAGIAIWQTGRRIKRSRVATHVERTSQGGANGTARGPTRRMDMGIEFSIALFTLALFCDALAFSFAYHRNKETRPRRWADLLRR